VSELSEQLSDVSEIVFFLMGAMTIVETVDAHQVHFFTLTTPKPVGGPLVLAPLSAEACVCVQLAPLRYRRGQARSGYT
jgi:hypothetical protein